LDTQSKGAFTVDKIINRRRLVAGAAALSVASVAETEAKTDELSDSDIPQIAEIASIKPDISEIPGLDQVHTVVMMVMVTTPDRRGGIANVIFRGAGAADIALCTDDGNITSQLPSGGLESLPTWMQKEIGYAALTASVPKERRAI
jgi:hypothetical protein